MEILDVVFVYQMQEENEMKWHSRHHAHGSSEYELHYVIQGNASFINDKTRYSIAAGNLVLTKQGVNHAILAPDPSNPITYYAVLIKLDEGDHDMYRLLNEQLSSDKVYPVGSNYRFFFEEIKEKGLSSSQALRASAMHQFISFLYVLAAEGEFHFADGRNAHIEKALRIMQNSITSDIDLEDISSRLGLSKSYFIRLFQQKMKTSPMKYFTKLKIEAASAMLSSTDRSLLVIAGDLNFYSEFHFSGVFKQYTGSSPSQYRKQYLQLAGNQ